MKEDDNGPWVRDAVLDALKGLAFGVVVGAIAYAAGRFV